MVQWALSLQCSSIIRGFFFPPIEMSILHDMQLEKSENALKNNRIYFFKKILLALYIKTMKKQLKNINLIFLN